MSPLCWLFTQTKICCRRAGETLEKQKINTRFDINDDQDMKLYCYLRVPTIRLVLLLMYLNYINLKKDANLFKLIS